MPSRRRVPKLGWDVRFGSLADMLTNPRHVRFTPITDVGQGKLHTHRSPVRLKRVDAPISMNLIQLSAWPCWRWLLGRVLINRQPNADLDVPPNAERFERRLDDLHCAAFPDVRSRPPRLQAAELQEIFED